MYEIATPDSGWSSAGRAANANDSSTVFGNPAGISSLDKVEVMIGLQPKYYNATFNVEQPQGQPNSDMQLWIPDASFFWATKIKKDFHFGIGALSFMGLALDYGDDWAGSQYVTKTGMATVDLVPAFSYRAEKLWSIGIGLDLMWGKFGQEFKGSAPLPAKKIEIKDSDFKVGWNIGALIFLGKKSRIGIKYRSQVKFEFEFELEATTEKPKLDMYVPQEAMISSYSELGKKWILMASIGWQNWSKFGNMNIKMAGFEDTIDKKLIDTWHLSVGAKLRAGEKSSFSFGVAYDTSAVNDEDRTLLMPFDAQMRVSAGYQLDVSKLSNLSFNLTWIGIGDAPIMDSQPPRPTIKGNYNPNMLYSLGVNYNWKW